MNNEAQKRTDPNPRKLVKYATNIVGKTFTIIQTTDVKPGDILLNFQVQHIGYTIPAKVKKIRKITSEFYDIEFEGYENITPLRFASSCLFGRQDGGRLNNTSNDVYSEHGIPRNSDFDGRF
mgnify:CR=1 FL=1